MSYDAFQRGPHPVGVKTESIIYQNGERRIPVEIWYPATDEYLNKDLNPELQDKYSLSQGFPETPQTAVRDAESKQDAFPLIVFSHGFAGHRRQTTHLMCHLASHGYVVISPDHIGNTLLDIMGLAGKMQEKGFSNIMGLFKSFMDNRPQDTSICIDEILGGRFGQSNDQGILSKMQKSSELCSGQKAYAFLQSACLAHFDAHVKNNQQAKFFLENDLLTLLGEQDISVRDYA